jgi:methyltransferase (TIGR00027 family)
MQDTPIRDVSDTAFMVAACRAMEGKRPDALFDDPLAGKLAGEHGAAIIASLRSASGWRGQLWTQIMTWMVALRTRIIDDFVLSCVSQGTDAVLCLGAGLDTRPHRMALPESLCWIEVDFPRVIELKESHLAGEKAHCHLERVKLDLTDLAARGQLFSDIGMRFKRVLVLTEGVVPYLPVEVAAQLADDLWAQRSFAHWIVDYFTPQILRYGRTGWMRNTPFLFAPKDYLGFFREHGWTAKETRYLWDEGERLYRPLPLPWVFKALLRVRGAFMSPAQRKELVRTSGYTLFERSAAP